MAKMAPTDNGVAWHDLCHADYAYFFIWNKCFNAFFINTLCQESFAFLSHAIPLKLECLWMNIN